jgi:fructose 1,6-bisphosphatase
MGGMTDSVKTGVEAFIDEIKKECNTGNPIAFGNNLPVLSYSNIDYIMSQVSDSTLLTGFSKVFNIFDIEDQKFILPAFHSGTELLAFIGQTESILTESILDKLNNDPPKCYVIEAQNLNQNERVINIASLNYYDGTLYDTTPITADD